MSLGSTRASLKTRVARVHKRAPLVSCCSRIHQRVKETLLGREVRYRLTLVMWDNSAEFLVTVFKTCLEDFFPQSTPSTSCAHQGHSTPKMGIMYAKGKVNGL